MSARLAHDPTGLNSHLLPRLCLVCIAVHEAAEFLYRFTTIWERYDIQDDLAEFLRELGDAMITVAYHNADLKDAGMDY